MSKTWFITGASRGFGALIAEAALGQGDNVVATARNPATVISRLGQPANLLAPPLDVTHEAQARKAAGSAIARFDAVRRIEAKNAFVAQELARWRDLASTDATSA
jgi:NAD(P)-dependent dehydrogenase (short-subunit alcohol dehydrogenase family)